MRKEFAAALRNCLKRLLKQTIKQLRMTAFVRGKGFKGAAAFPCAGGKCLILRLPGQLCLITLPDGFVEAGRADRLPRFRTELFPGHEKIERAELPRVAAFLLRKA